MIKISKIREALLRKHRSDDLSDNEFFMSDGYKSLIKSIIQGAGSQYDTEEFNVSLYDRGADAFVAYASADTEVALNISNSLTVGADRPKRHRILVGIVLHECGHRLFTDTYWFQKYASECEKKCVLPNAPKVTAFIKKNKGAMKAILSLLHQVQNSIEDAFIELILLAMFPGYGKYLQEVRDIQLARAISYEEMGRRKLSATQKLFNLLLIYAKYQVIKVEDEDSAQQDPVYAGFLTITPVIDEARVEKSFKKRVYASEKVLDAFWALLDELSTPDNQPQQSGQGQQGNQQGGQGQGNNSSSSTNSDENQSNGNEETSAESGQQSSEEPNGSSNSQNGENTDESQSNGEGAPTSKGSDESQDNESSGDNQQSSDAASPADAGSGIVDMQTVMNDINSLAKDAKLDASQRDGHRSMVSDSEQEQIEADLNKSASQKSPESSQKEESDDKADPDANKLNRVERDELDKQAKEKAQAEVNDSANKEVAAMHVSTTNWHKGISHVIGDASSTPASNLPEISQELSIIYRNLCKEFCKKIKERLEKSWEDGYYSGRRVSHPYRMDMKRMSRKVTPEEDFDMAIGLVLDLSMSMRWDGKAEQTKRAAMLLCEFCNELNIPLCIYGHGEYGKIHITRFKEFDSVDGYEVYRLSNLCSCVGGGTRDGYTVRIMAEKLLKRPEHTKLLMVISDGEPCSSEYEFEPGDTAETSNAKADIDDILTVYGRKGINFVTAGIGDDADNIKPLWQKGLSSRVAAKYLDISDLSKMPKIFVETVKGYLE